MNQRRTSPSSQAEFWHELWCQQKDADCCTGATPTDRAWTGLKPLPDQEAALLILVQLELLDGRRFSPLAIRCFDRADMFAFAAHDDGPCVATAPPISVMNWR